MLPVIELLDLTQEPTCGQLNDGLLNLFSKDRRSDDRVLHVGHEKYSVLMRKVKAS